MHPSFLGTFLFFTVYFASALFDAAWLDTLYSERVGRWGRWALSLRFIRSVQIHREKKRGERLRQGRNMKNPPNEKVGRHLDAGMSHKSQWRLICCSQDTKVDFASDIIFLNMHFYNVHAFLGQINTFDGGWRKKKGHLPGDLGSLRNIWPMKCQQKVIKT